MCILIINKMNEEIKTEKCVLCGAETNIPVDLHIDLRKNYVEGVGQLCDDCAKKIHYSNE